MDDGERCQPRIVGLRRGETEMNPVGEQQIVEGILSTYMKPENQAGFDQRTQSCRDEIAHNGDAPIADTLV